jgi:signal transduction histidine kinase
VLQRSNPPVFATGIRWGLSAAAVAAAGCTVWMSGPELAGPEGTDRYVLAHGLGAVPFLVVGLAATWRVLQVGPREYRPFWGRWLGASLSGVMAATAAILAVATDDPGFLLVDMALLVAGMPLWVSATILMARLQAGRRSVSVDVVDALSALLVLGTPGVLLVAGPLAETDKLSFAVPFAVTAVAAPVSVYLSVVNLSRIPAGERAAQGLGVALGGAASVNLTMQLARVLGGLTLPLRAFVAVHVVNMGLLMATPLWAHRQPIGRLGLRPDHHQVRRANPMPYVSAAVLPVLAGYVFLTRDDRPWGVWLFVVVVLGVVALNAVRYTAMSRETRRLYAGIARMAEERRRLLTRMLRGLEDDRHRTASELHSQAVGELATLGTLVQLARVALPGDAALTVTETVARLQGDLSARAEHLRQLMLAIRPPELVRSDNAAPPGNDTLAAALLAYASEVGSEAGGPVVRVEVDPGLRLDWTTMTVVYRIAQEALRNAIQHALASTVGVSVADKGGHVVVEVVDDGVGFEPAEAAWGSGMATMELFSQLGRGELTVRSTPGDGAVVRCRLGVGTSDGGTVGRGEADGVPTGPPGAVPGGAAPRHLRVVAGSDDG